MTDVVEKLKNDGEVAGRFEWAGHHDPDGPGTPGVLRWSPEDGATLQLIGPHERWPDDFISTGMTINGVTDDGGELTLFDAWISRMSMIPQRVISLKSSALLAGAQLSGDERWTSGAYRTAHLHEWLPETGLLPREYGADETAWPPKRLTIAWEPPTPHHINLPAGRLTLSHGMASPSRWGPEISIKTWLNAHAKPTEPMAIDELWRTFVSPLLALTTLASGRADGVTFERLTDPGAERAVEVIRMGDKIPMRGWREGRSWLFDARAFDEVGATVRTWYELYEKSYPAIAMFGQTLEAPNNYSSGRLVELYTALEVYSRACHHVRGENAADKLARLHEYTGLPPELSGCSRHNLKLIHASRNYFVHPERTVLYGFSLEQLHREAPYSTARLTALMQGCLMRDLGLSPDDVANGVRQHWGGWLTQSRAT